MQITLVLLVLIIPVMNNFASLMLRNGGSAFLFVTGIISLVLALPFLSLQVNEKYGNLKLKKKPYKSHN